MLVAVAPEGDVPGLRDGDDGQGRDEGGDLHF